MLDIWESILYNITKVIRRRGQRRLADRREEWFLMNETLTTDKYTDTDEQFSDSYIMSKDYFIERCTQ